MSGFAGLAFGLVGGFLFGPIGFMVGSLIGNLLFPQQQQGPRLTDLKLHNSGYGIMVPIVYGAMRVPAIVIWQTDLKEHSHNSGGKGGPSVTTFTYSASFAEYLCEGPIDFVRRIWADGTLIYDADSTDGNLNTLPCVVYPGDEAQLPDPTIEGELGVGNTPAYRGKAYVVFDDWDLTNYGNRIPNLNFEVIKGEQGPIPWRVSTFTPTLPHGNTHRDAVLWDDANGVAVYSAFYSDGSLHGWYQQRSRQLDGTVFGTDINVQLDALDSFAVSLDTTGGLNSGAFAVGFANEGDGTHKGWYYHNSLVNNLGLSSQFAANVVQLGNFLYSVASSPVRIQRRPIVGNVPASVPDASLTLPALSLGSYTYSDTKLVPGDNGLLYFCIDKRGLLSTNILLYELNPDLTVSRSWQDGQVPTDFSFAATFVIYKGMACATNFLGVLNGVFNLWQIQAPGVTWPLIGNLPVTQSNAGFTGLIRFHNGLVSVGDGIISLDPQLLSSSVTLASIVQDQSERAGLMDSQIDVTSLTDIVDGYIVQQQQDCRSNITPLQSAYFFDAVESSGVVKFVKRGGAPAVTIPDNDLAAQASAGGTPPPLVTAKRVQEVDLPAILHVKYMNGAAAYQTGDQMSQRQVTSSQLATALELAINMTDAKAKQIANTLLFNGWVEREQFTLLTSRKYDYLEPTDVIIAHGYELRIVNKSDVVSGVIQFDGVAALSNLWTQGPTGSSGQGNTTPVTPTGNQPTNFVPLDIPLLVDTDSQDGFYAAMAGSIDSTWRGANLYISRDNGSTYEQISSLGVASVIGAASTVLPTFEGGNIFDELNSVTVVIGVGGGTLSSMSELAVLNGANKALLGTEIIQFKTATLTAPSTYVLSGLLRGRRGTEFEMVTHVIGERFVFMPSTADVTLTFSDLGQVRIYKAVTFSTSLAATTPTSFLCNGVALRPYAPVLLGGAPNAGNDIVINWTRRTRIGGAWADFTDVPLSEPSELYVLQVWDSLFSTCARVVTGIGAPTFTYTSAMQVADFGRIQQTVYISVGQLGTFGLGAQANAAIAGAGSFVDAPAHPVQPYNTSPPPSPPTGGGCTGGGTVTNVTLTWGTGGSFSTPSDFGPGDAWVFKIPVPSSPAPYVLNITAFEFGGPPTPRNYTLSLSPCGEPIQPSAQAQGNTGVSVTAWGGFVPSPPNAPQLLPGVTYYLTITTDGVSEMSANVSFKTKGS